MQKNYAIGIDIGGTNLRVAKVSPDGEIVRKTAELTSEELLESLHKAIGPLFSDDIAAVGIGVAGLISRERKKVSISPNLHAVEKLDLVKEIGERYGVPVFIENDANAAAYGEMWVGAGKDIASFVLFTLGTGIGGGVVHEKQLLRIPAEIGHMSIISDGEKCPCGNTGCLESYASARAILSRAVFYLEAGRESALQKYYEGNFYRLTTEDIFRAALDGDNLARELWKNAGRYLGVGIASMINLMGPDAVILAGGLTGAWDIYIQEAIKEASRRAFRELFERVTVIPSQLEGNAGLIGAAGIAFNSVGMQSG
jgi:glucokinase